MKILLILLLGLISTNCLAEVTKESFQNFLKDYFSSKEKTIWQEVIYALEKDYDDDLIIYSLNKFGLQSPVYLSRKLSGHTSIDFKDRRIHWDNYTEDKSPVDVKNILITCVRKKRLHLFEELLYYFSSKYKDAISEYRFEYYTNAYNYIPVYERRISNIIIRETSNYMDYLMMLVNYFNINVYTISIFNFSDYPTNVYPIELAFEKLDSELIKYLFDNGSRDDVTIKGRSLFFWSILHNRADIAEILLEKHPGNATSFLFDAITLKNKDAIILCLNYGADPLKPLELAFEINDPEIIDILMAVVYSKERA
jgi:hypothetical protein